MSRVLMSVMVAIGMGSWLSVLQARAATRAVGPVVLTNGSGAAEPGFLHAVYFWLRADLTADQRAAFVGGLRSLGQSPEVAQV
ncbi:MAG: hypothetical protein ACFCVE_05415 [Phycisphaerae bacterium]